jgi:hypothetical protein
MQSNYDSRGKSSKIARSTTTPQLLVSTGEFSENDHLQTTSHQMGLPVIGADLAAIVKKWARKSR